MTPRLLADDMGLGKTRMALHLIPIGWGAIVVSPVNARGEWAEECQKLFPDIKISPIKTKGQFRLPLKDELIICNYEQVNSREAPMVAYLGHKVVLICDEMHLIKNPEAQKTISLRAIASAILDCRGRVYGLTGTPLLNRATELWQHAVTLGMQDYLFPGGWPEFTKLGGLGKRIVDHTYWDGKRKVTRKVEKWVQVHLPLPEFSNRISRMVIRRTRKDVFPQTPPKIRKFVSVPVAGEGSDEVKKVLKELSSSMQGEDIETSLNCPLRLKDISRMRKLASEVKYPYVLDWVTEHEELYPKEKDGYPCPIIVAGHHTEALKRLASREDWMHITGDCSADQRKQTAQLFKEGKLAGVAISITAGGQGINLWREGANRMLFIEEDFRPGFNLQMEDRLRPHLISQQCEYTYLRLNHPIDVLVSENRRQKMELINHVGLGEGEDDDE